MMHPHENLRRNILHDEKHLYGKVSFKNNKTLYGRMNTEFKKGNYLNLLYSLPACYFLARLTTVATGG